MTGDYDSLGTFFKMTHFQSQAMSDEEIAKAKEFLLQWAGKL
jgi:hypothetical protein